MLTQKVVEPIIRHIIEQVKITDHKNPLSGLSLTPNGLGRSIFME